MFGGLQRAVNGIFGQTGVRKFVGQLPWSMGGAPYESLPGPQNWIRGITGVNQIIDAPYSQHPTVATAIEIIAEDSASVGWQMCKDEAPGTRVGRDVSRFIPDHPILHTWQHPNENVSGMVNWFTFSYTCDLVFGECFWYYPELVMAKPDAPDYVNDSLANRGLYLLDPRRIGHKLNKDTGAVDWFWRDEYGSDKKLDASRLTQVRRFNPYHFLRGLPKTTAIIAEIEGDHYAAQWNQRFFKDNNGVPTIALIPPQSEIGLTKDQKDEITRTWNDRHGGTSRQVGIVYPGWEIKDLMVTQKDMDFHALRDYSREQILGLYGVPPFRAGVLDKANYANARAQDEVYWNGTVSRFLARWAAAINEDFFPKIGISDVRVEPRFELVKHKIEDLKTKTEVATEWFAMGLSKKVINERLDMGWISSDIPDYEEGYVKVTGKSTYVPVSMVEEVVRETMKQPALAAKPASDDGDDGDANPTPVAAGQLVRAMQKKLRGFFHGVQKELQGKIDGLPGFMLDHTHGNEHPGAMKALLVDQRQTSATLRGIMAPVLRDALVLGSNGRIDDEDPRVIGCAAALAAQMSIYVHAISREWAEEVNRSAQGGVGIDGLDGRLSEICQRHAKLVSAVARDEVVTAVEAGKTMVIQGQLPAA